MLLLLLLALLHRFCACFRDLVRRLRHGGENVVVVVVVVDIVAAVGNVLVLAFPHGELRLRVTGRLYYNGRCHFCTGNRGFTGTEPSDTTVYTVPN